MDCLASHLHIYLWKSNQFYFISLGCWASFVFEVSFTLSSWIEASLLQLQSVLKMDHSCFFPWSNHFWECWIRSKRNWSWTWSNFWPLVQVFNSLHNYYLFGYIQTYARVKFLEQTLNVKYIWLTLFRISAFGSLFSYFAIVIMGSSDGVSRIFQPEINGIYF